MVVGITLSGPLEWNFPASLSAMVNYQILTLEKLTGAQGSSSSPHLSCSDKLCPISSLFTSFIQEVIYDLDEEMFSCCF